MNANTIISDDMTLDQKLAAIDAALLNAQAVTKDSVDVDVDPSEALMCEGCQ